MTYENRPTTPTRDRQTRYTVSLRTFHPEGRYYDIRLDAWVESSFEGGTTEPFYARDARDAIGQVREGERYHLGAEHVSRTTITGVNQC